MCLIQIGTIDVKDRDRKKMKGGVSRRKRQNN